MTIHGMLWRRTLLILLMLGEFRGVTLSAPSSLVPGVGSNAATPDRSFAEWKAACLKVPSNRALKGNLIPAGALPLRQFRELADLISALFAQCQAGPLGQTNLWVGEAPTTTGFFNTDSAYFLGPNVSTSPLVQSFLVDTHPSRATPTVFFQPFAQKLEVPEGAEVFLHADLHGDIRSLLADLDWLTEQGYLRDFTVTRPGFYLVFFGDYADRGRFGVEVLYTLLRLKLTNPDRVFLGRGNHEEVSLAARYGFLSEGRVKYGAEFDAKKVLRAYDFLPVVIYLGAAGNYIQCNHGGMEPGFDPRPLLDAPGTSGFQFIGTLKQRQFLTSHPEWFARSDRASRDSIARVARDFRPDDPINPATLGFMWNDFSLVSEEPDFTVDPGRAFVYGQQATQFLLSKTQTKSSVVQAVFRGHQQSQTLNPIMRRLLASHGVFRHWQARDSVAKLGAEIQELKTFIERAEERLIPPGSVWTFNMAPDSAYGEGCGYSFDSFGILKTASNFADWRLRVINVEVGL